uniref:Uncharacterized protein n=1 Tax=Caenorhabditis japonica TaxID=281687 RepID=A0A8R1IKQ6_CAEJA
MSSIVLAVANLDLAKLRAVYLQVDMVYDNRKNAAYAVLNMISRFKYKYNFASIFFNASEIFYKRVILLAVAWLVPNEICAR